MKHLSDLDTSNRDLPRVPTEKALAGVPVYSSSWASSLSDLKSQEPLKWDLCSCYVWFPMPSAMPGTLKAFEKFSELINLLKVTTVIYKLETKKIHTIIAWWNAGKEMFPWRNSLLSKTISETPYAENGAHSIFQTSWVRDIPSGYTVNVRCASVPEDDSQNKLR